MSAPNASRSGTPPRTNPFAHLLSSAALIGFGAKAKTDGDETAQKAKKVKKNEDDPAAQGEESCPPKSQTAKHPEPDGDEDENGEETDDEDNPDREDDGDEEAEDADTVKRAKASGQGPVIAAARRIERRRCQAIFQSKASAGRVPTACQLAFGTNMSASSAITLLQTVPGIQAAAPEPTHNEDAELLAAMSQFRADIGDGGAAPAANSADDALFAACQNVGNADPSHRR